MATLKLIALMLFVVFPGAAVILVASLFLSAFVWVGWLGVDGDAATVLVGLTVAALGSTLAILFARLLIPLFERIDF